MADERNAGHTDTSLHMRLLLKEGHNAEVVFALAGPSQEGNWAAELARAL